MVKNIQAILICIACFIIVAFIYIGGLRSDARIEKQKRHEEKSLTEKTSSDSAKTNSISEKNINTSSSNSKTEKVHTEITEEKDSTDSETSLPAPTQLPPQQDNKIIEEPKNQETGVQKQQSSSTIKKQTSVISQKTTKSTPKQNSTTKENIIGSLKSSGTISNSGNKDKDVNDTPSISEEETLTTENESLREIEDIDTSEVDDATILIDNEDNISIKLDDTNIEETIVEIEDEKIQEVDEEGIEVADEQEDDSTETGETLTTLEQAKKLATIGDLDSFLELTKMVESTDDTLEKRELIKIAGTMSNTLEPEILFEIIKVSTSEEMLKMAVVTLSEANKSTIVDMAANNYAATTDTVEQDYLLDVIVNSNDPAVVNSLSDIASKNSYSTAIGQAAINTLAIIGSKESTENLLNRIDKANSETDIELLTKSVSKIHTSAALATLKNSLSVNTGDVAKSIAIVKALGNYPAQDVSQTLDNLYNQENLNSSLKYEIDKTYEKITK